MTRFGIPICLFLVAACATVKEEKEEKAKPEPKGPDLVGAIASVPKSGGFVLIRSYRTWDLPPGSILTSRGDGERAANLRFSGEILGEFVAADIQAGEVEKGDAVYSFHKPKPTTPEFVPEIFPSAEDSPGFAPTGDFPTGDFPTGDFPPVTEE